MWPKERLIDEIQMCFTPCHSLGLRVCGVEESSKKTTASISCVVLRGFFMHCWGFFVLFISNN